MMRKSMAAIAIACATSTPAIGAIYEFSFESEFFVLDYEPTEEFNAFDFFSPSAPPPIGLSALNVKFEIDETKLPAKSVYNQEINLFGDDGEELVPAVRNLRIDCIPQVEDCKSKEEILGVTRDWKITTDSAGQVVDWRLDGVGNRGGALFDPSGSAVGAPIIFSAPEGEWPFPVGDGNDYWIFIYRASPVEWTTTRISPVPIPPTVALLPIGIFGLMSLRRKRTRRMGALHP